MMRSNDSEQSKPSNGGGLSPYDKYSGLDTPLRVIRTKCLDCCCGQWNEVKLCPCEDCSLWLYRFGKRPQSVKNQELVTKNGGAE